MGAIDSLFFMVGKWFGYVGACVFTPDATCRPFLAFFALGAAACAALILVLLAYRAAGTLDTESAADGARSQGLPEPARSARIEPRIVREPELGSRLRAA